MNVSLGEWFLVFLVASCFLYFVSNLLFNAALDDQDDDIDNDLH